MAIVRVSENIELEYLWWPRGADASTDEPPRDPAGPPLLLVQGMSGTMHTWGNEFLSRLATGVDVLLFHNRGIKESSRVAEQFTIRDLAADTAGLLGVLGLGRVHVLGVSMGGMVAQELALGWPELIHTLTIGCSYPGGPGAAVLTSEAAASLFQNEGGPDAVIQASWQINLGKRYRDGDVDGRRFDDFRSSVLRRRVAGVVIQMQALALASNETQSRLADITNPTLVVHGTDDRMLPHVNSEIIAARIPGARLELWEDVGHLWWWEEPERAATLVLEHVAAAGPA